MLLCVVTAIIHVIAIIGCGWRAGETSVTLNPLAPNDTFRCHKTQCHLGPLTPKGVITKEA